MRQSADGEPQALSRRVFSHLQNDYSRPISLHRLAAALDTKGNPVAWTDRTVAPFITVQKTPESVKGGLDPKVIVEYATRLCVLVFFLLPLPANAQESQVVYEVRSPYQLITVQDTAGGYRQLIFDGRFDGSDAIQSEMSLAHPDEPSLSYARHMIAVLPLVDGPRRVLVVGLGGACIQRCLRKLVPNATIETVELDPEMPDVAAKYFFFKQDARQIVYLGDGRTFIERSKEKYDLILLDAFSATSIPHHLTTQEFLQAVKDHLAPGGVACANLWDAEASYWDMVKTYFAVFPEALVMKCAASGNSLVLALPAKADLTVKAWAEKAAAFEKTRPTGLDLPGLILRGAAPTTSIPETARVLVDKGAAR